MAKASQDLDGFIDPSVGYTLHGLAKILGWNVRSLREELINTGVWQSAEISRSVRLVPGWVVIRWMEENLGGPGE